MRTIWALDKERTWAGQAAPSAQERAMLYYVHSGGRYVCAPEYTTYRKDYERYLLAYTTGGTGHLEYRDREYVLKKGDGFLIYCGDQQMYKTDETDLWRFSWVHFNGSDIKSYYHKIYSDSGPVFRSEEDGHIPVTLEKILQLFDAGEFSMQYMASMYIVQILTELILKGGGASDRKERNNIHLEEAIDQLETSFERKLTLDELAATAKVSKFHFIRSFKEYTGYSPFEYLKKIRLTNAKELLRRTNDSVENIAARVGYQSTSHFIKTFREAEQVTPYVFRKYG